MKNLFICVWFWSLFFLLSTSCANEKKNKIQKKEKEKTEWSYEGESSPEHWSEIETDSDCSGSNQSPVNIIDSDAKRIENNGKLKVLYSPETILSKVYNNGHSIQFDFEKGDSIQYINETYHLKQIHFHEPAEHLINGIRYPIEIHLVHTGKKGDYTVLSILGEEGHPSELFGLLDVFLPLKYKESKEIDQKLDLEVMFPKSNSFYSYRGSLTTPPCSESVNWVIFKEQIIVPLESVQTLKENMPINNFRNEQPLNDRTIHLNHVD